MLFIAELIGIIFSVAGTTVIFVLTALIAILGFMLMAAKKVIPAMQDEL